MDKDLDRLISKYTDDLITLKEKWTQMGIKTQNDTTPIFNENNIEPEKASIEPPTEEGSSENYTENYPDTAVKPDEEQENISPTKELPLARPENFALFTAKVYSGRQSYAVPDAKISIYLDGKLHAFLITDENGATKQIKLESYPAINNFIPDNTEQTLDYSADIFAEGFAERKGLLVSAVGGSEILLNAELTPLSERID
jgi:hypothetical protein